MIFPIKWGDFERKLKKRFALQEEARSTIFYFDSEIELYIYQETERGNVLCSLLLKDSIQDLVAFKQEYLADATEFTRKLKEDPILSIKLE